MQKAILENGTNNQDTKRAAFFRARLPIEYHPQSASLTNAGEYGRQVLDWIQLDTLKKISERSVVLEVVGKSANARDIFYLAARAMMLRSVALRCCFASDLLYDRIGLAMGDEVMEKGVLAIDKMGWAEKSFFTAENTYDVEVFLEKWLNSGRSLILRSEVSVSKAPQWSEEFKNYIKRKTKASFIIP